MLQLETGHPAQAALLTQAKAARGQLDKLFAELELAEQQAVALTTQAESAEGTSRMARRARSAREYAIEKLEIAHQHIRRTEELYESCMKEQGSFSVRREAADLYWQLLRWAERRLDPAAARYLQALTQLADDRYVDLVEGTATLEIISDVSGAQASLFRIVEDDDLRLTAGDPIALGETPIAPQDLEPGSYLLELTAEGRTCVRRPILVGRGEDIQLEIRMFPSRRVGADFVYVPAGSFAMGGDPLAPGSGPGAQRLCDNFALARNPVTVGQYQTFIDALAEQDPGRALAFTPKGGLGNLQNRRNPVTGIPRAAAEAYCQWLSARSDYVHRLPTETEWEKAARGTDARRFVWGETFVAGYCLNRAATRGEPTLEEVGTRSTDCSVYGVQDMAGGVAEWTSSQEDDLTVARGGSFQEGIAESRAARRLLVEPGSRQNIGFRVVRALPSGGGERVLEPRVPEHRTPDASPETNRPLHLVDERDAVLERCMAIASGDHTLDADDLVAESATLTRSERVMWIDDVDSIPVVRACFSGQGDALPETDRGFDQELVAAAHANQSCRASEGEHPVLVVPVTGTRGCLFFERRFQPAPFGDQETMVGEIVADLIGLAATAAA